MRKCKDRLSPSVTMALLMHIVSYSPLLHYVAHSEGSEYVPPDKVDLVVEVRHVHAHARRVHRSVEASTVDPSDDGSKLTLDRIGQWSYDVEQGLADGLRGAVKVGHICTQPGIAKMITRRTERRHHTHANVRPKLILYILRIRHEDPTEG